MNKKGAIRNACTIRRTVDRCHGDESGWADYNLSAKNHPEYQEIEARQKKLIEDYPMLWKVVDGDGTVTLNEKEHCALKEYLSNQDDMERLEKNTIIIMDNPMYSLMGAC